MFIWNPLAFSVIQRLLAIWSLFPLPFLNPAWTSGSSWITYSRSLAWRILSITLLAMMRWVQLCSSLSILCHCLSLELEWKQLFQSCSHCWVFQICWHIECSTFTTSSFRIWNSSTGIPSLPLALFVVMLPKAHLTSDSRMSCFRWVIIPSWLSGSWKSFLYSSSVYVFLPPLLNLFCFWDVFGCHNLGGGTGIW